MSLPHFHKPDRQYVISMSSLIRIIAVVCLAIKKRAIVAKAAKTPSPRSHQKADAATPIKNKTSTQNKFKHDSLLERRADY